MPTRLSLLFLVVAGPVVAAQGPLTSSLVFDPASSATTSTIRTTIRTTVTVTLTSLSSFLSKQGAYIDPIQVANPQRQSRSHLPRPRPPCLSHRPHRKRSQPRFIQTQARHRRRHPLNTPPMSARPHHQGPLLPLLQSQVLHCASTLPNPAHF